MKNTIFSLLVLSILSASCGRLTTETKTKESIGQQSCKVSESLDAVSHEFMRANKLIRPDDETSSSSNISARWTLVKAEVVEGKCLLKMDLCIVAFGTRSCENSALEVIGLENQKPVLFENLFPIKSIRVAVGEAFVVKNNGEKVKNDNFYFLEFNGKDAVSAWKAIKLKLPYSGLLASISAKNGSPDGAINFDPTPGRKWKLKDSSWSLRRGSTTEIMDVYSEQLDGDFSTYFSGSAGKIGPWSSYIIKYFDMKNKRWTETGIGEVVTNEHGGSVNL